MTEIYSVSAFCKDKKGGNKAGVVTNSTGLTRQDKLNIAKSLGYSETVFIAPSDRADYRLEYFTPADEVPLCGHATIATFALMYVKQLLEKQTCTIETKAGILKIHVNDDGLVMMQQNQPAFYEMLRSEDFTGCFDISKIRKDIPARIVSTGLRDIMLPVASKDDLAELTPDFEAIKTLSSERDVIGVHAFALLNDKTAEDKKVTAICRNFAPLYDIDEESATGTSNCALACYLYSLGLQQNRYVFSQGHQLGEISEIIVELKTKGDKIEEVWVGGYGQILQSITM